MAKFGMKISQLIDFDLDLDCNDEWSDRDGFPVCPSEETDKERQGGFRLRSPCRKVFQQFVRFLDLQQKRLQRNYLGFLRKEKHMLPPDQCNLNCLLAMGPFNCQNTWLKTQILSNPCQRACCLTSSKMAFFGTTDRLWNVWMSCWLNVLGIAWICLDASSTLYIK